MLLRVIYASEFINIHLNNNTMPVRKVSGGYQWGTSGKVYPTKEQAEKQGRAILASGWREKKK